MSALNQIMMFHMGVSDMAASKKFYESTMGFKVTTDYGEDSKHWVSLELPGGGASMNLTTALENLKPGSMKLYLSTKDIEAAHEELADNGATFTKDISDDLYGPGSGVKWFSLDDPDGNHWLVVQA